MEKARLEYRYFDVFIRFFLMSKGEHISLVRGDNDFLGSLQKMCEELPPKTLCNDVEIVGGAKHNRNITMSLEIYKPARKSQLDQTPLEELSGGDAGLDGQESMESSSRAIQKYVHKGRPPSKAVQQQRAEEKAAEDRQKEWAVWSAKLEMSRLRTNCLSSQRDDLIHTLADKEEAYKSIMEAPNRTDAENLELRAMQAENERLLTELYETHATVEQSQRGSCVVLWIGTGSIFHWIKGMKAISSMMARAAEAVAILLQEC
jgi:hypothetical protein